MALKHFLKKKKKHKKKKKKKQKKKKKKQRESLWRHMSSEHAGPYFAAGIYPA